MQGVVDVSQLYGLLPLGPLRDKREVDISAADHVDEGGFVCQAGKAGTLTYRTVGGDADQAEAVTAGAVVQAAGIPVLLKAVRANSTIASIVIGKL
ncbi:MAG: hypothetical protein OXH59_01705 [Rhodospirillaceae bacterium]|nr:hypothetical protein [Rhodospirillaceae bacterium]